VLTRSLAVPAHSHDNYKDGISANTLIRKDLFDITNGSEERPMDKDLLKAWKRSDLKAFSAIDASFLIVDEPKILPRWVDTR
jgi:hypothetical protein